MSKTLVFVSGNIGSGKTSLIDNFCNSLPSHKVVKVLEPVSEWENDLAHLNSGNANVNDLFNFQVKACQTMTSLTLKGIRESVRIGANFVLVERDPDSTYATFVKYHNEARSPIHWTEPMKAQLFNLFNESTASIQKEMRSIGFGCKYVYLSTSVQTCYHRMIHQRGRDCEKKVSIGYLTGIGKLYDDHFRLQQNVCSEVSQNTVVLNGMLEKNALLNVFSETLGNKPIVT